MILISQDSPYFTNTKFQAQVQYNSFWANYVQTFTSKGPFINTLVGEVEVIVVGVIKNLDLKSLTFPKWDHFFARFVRIHVNIK